MENAIDALKMAFAILVFVVAITVSFSSISQAKKTSDFIIKNIDKTNFYERLGATDLETTNGGRKVNIDTIISNLYRIVQESFEVKVIIGTDTFEFGLNNMTTEELELAINNFKLEYLDKDYTYIETFSEITYTGKYITEEDGSQITVTPGLKKVYITYTKIN